MLGTSWRRNDGASPLRPFETSLLRPNKMSWRRTTETPWRRSIETSLGISFESCLRRCGDVMVGRLCYVLFLCRYGVSIRRRGDAPLRCLGDVPSRRRWVFHLRCTCDVTGTYRETSLRRLNARWGAHLKNFMNNSNRLLRSSEIKRVSPFFF